MALSLDWWWLCLWDGSVGVVSVFVVVSPAWWWWWWWCAASLWVLSLRAKVDLDESLPIRTTGRSAPKMALSVMIQIYDVCSNRRYFPLMITNQFWRRQLWRLLNHLALPIPPIITYRSSWRPLDKPHVEVVAAGAVVVLPTNPSSHIPPHCPDTPSSSFFAASQLLEEASNNSSQKEDGYDFDDEFCFLHLPPET